MIEFVLIVAELERKYPLRVKKKFVLNAKEKAIESHEQTAPKSNAPIVDM